MPNGSDCSAVLQTEALCVPTQWVVFDCTADGRVGGWLSADLANEIDYLHQPPRAKAALDTKAALIAQRPGALRAVLDAHERRRAQGSKGRVVVWFVADLSDPAGRRMLAELPLDLANVLFWKSGVAPAVVRVGLGSDRADRGRFLRMVRDQYFGLPDFTAPYEGRHTAGQVYGNAFDATLLCAADEDLKAILAHLVPLHLEETAFARSHLERVAPGGLLVIEDAMRNSLRWRRIDWLAVAMYPYFKRLWEAPGDDILEVLDYRRCPARESDPWAAIKQRSREKNWDGIGYDLGPTGIDLMRSEAPYRITPRDHATRLHLAGFLQRQGAHEEALAQCEVARTEGGYEADVKWVKVEAVARHGMGEKERARQLFTDYRTALMSAPDPSAEALDEAATVALLAEDFAFAFETARRAVEKDRFLGHAYDTMVIAGRASGKKKYESTAAALAAKNGMVVPLYEREKTSRVLENAKVTLADADDFERPKKWWQFWR